MPGAVWHVAPRIYDAASNRLAKGDRRGTHLFRYNAETTFVGNGVSRPVTRAVLDHENPASLDYYTFADIQHLRECALSIQKLPVREGGVIYEYLRSGFSQEIEKFVSYRKASDTWNEYASGQNLKYFDRHCTDNYADSSILTQDMVDTWCSQRNTENSSSCYIRTLVIREFVSYLHDHGLTEILPPKAPRLEKRKYIPHAFTDDELARFFDGCDSIAPYRGRMASVIRKLQCPVFFRLLYSSGIRTTEARFFKKKILI